MALSYYTSHRKVSTTNISKDKKTMIAKVVGFPIVFLFVFAPLGIDRLILAVSSNVPPPNLYVAIAVIIFVSNGFWNAMVYGVTRKIFQRCAKTIKAVTHSEHL